MIQCYLHHRRLTTAHLNREINHYLEDAPVDGLTLLEDRILCRVIKKPSKIKSFTVRYYEYSVKTNIGRVLLLGQTYDGILKIGQYVVFNSWSGREFQSPDETLILLRPSDVEAVIEKEET